MKRVREKAIVNVNGVEMFLAKDREFADDDPIVAQYAVLFADAPDPDPGPVPLKRVGRKGGSA